MGQQWWQQYFEQPEACGLFKQTPVSSVCTSVFFYTCVTAREDGAHDQVC